jgi:TP901 family phage tail tape measure protein
MARQFARLQQQANREATQAVRARSRAQSQAAREMINLERQQRRELQRTNQQMADLTEAWKTLAGRMRVIQPEYDAVFRAGYRMQEVGRDMMQLGRRGIEAIAGMASEFGEFEFMVNRATGAMGLNHQATEKGVSIYERFKSRILETSRELRLFVATDVAKAVYFWASATGQQVDSLTDLEAVLKNIAPLMKIAAMTQTDYETAIKGVYAITIQYGMGLNSVGRVTEKLHQVTQRTAAEFPDLVNSFKMVGPVAAANSVTFDEVANVLGRLADAGIRSTMSGRGLRQFFIQTVRPSAIAKAALDDLWASTPAFMGKTFDEMVFPGGSFGGIDRYINLLAKALKGATEAQRNFYLARITTANELPIVTALVVKEIDVLNGVSKGWDKTKEASQTAAEGFRQSWEKLANSWLGVVGSVERGIESLRIIIGGRIANALAPVMEQIAAALESMIKWVEDPRNEDIIDFFVKAAAAISAFLAAGGGLMLFVGSLTNLGAAIMVVARVFAPLLGQFIKFAGVIGVVASAVVRNFDYIADGAREIVANLEDAFGTKGKGVNAVTSAFEAFNNVVGPIFDFIIRRAVDLVVALSSVIKILTEFAPTAVIIQAVATALGLLFATRIINGIVGMAASIGTLVKSLVTIRAAASSFYLLDNGVKIQRTTRAVGGLAGAFSGLKGAMAGGWIGIALVGLLTAYEILPPFKDAVDSLFRSIQGEAKIANDRVDELLGTIERGPEVRRWLEASERFQQLRRDAEAARAAVAGYESQPVGPASGYVDWSGRASAKQARDDAELAMATYLDNFMNTSQKLVDNWNAHGYEISMDDFWNKFLYFRQGGYTEKQAFKAANQYWDSVVSGWDSAGEQARALMARANTGTVSPVGFMVPNTKQQEAEILAALVGMKDRVTPQMAEQIEEMVAEAGRGGFGVGFEEAGEEADKEAAKMWSGVASSITTNSKEMLGIGKKIRDLIKDYVSPSRAMTELSETTAAWIKKGFRNSKGKWQTAAVTEIMGGLQTVVNDIGQLSGTMPVSDYNQMVNNQIEKVIETYKGEFENLPPAMQDTVVDSITSLYGFMGMTEVPQSVWDDLGRKGQKVPEVVAGGVTANTSIATTATANAISAIERTVRFGKKPFEEGASVPVDVKNGIDSKKGQATTAATNVKNQVNKNLDPGNKPHEQGKKVPTNFAKGMNKMRGNVVTAASNLANATKGAGKYVKSAWNWGNSLATNLWRGMLNQIQTVQNTARRLAGVIAGPLEHNSPAKEGPLKDDDKWGGRFVQNIVDGMHGGIPKIRQEALAVARAMQVAQSGFASNGVTFESSANRVIKVQVEVTSPDGSVDRVKASQLSQSLATNDLILAIEHMSTVG